MKKKRAYVYTRVSTSMQIDGYSLDAQEERIKQYAKAYDIEIVDVYKDAGKSGTSIIGRNNFITMLDDIKEEKDNVDCVLVFKLSRFGRNAADTLNSLQVMEEHGVYLISVDDGLDSSKDAGKLVITILSAVAEMEREYIIAQTMEGRKQKAREGKWNGGFAPIGYKLQDGELIINEDEAKAIKMIFDLYTNSDMGANGVAKYLASLDIRKPIRQNGKSLYFSASLIRQILDNPVYNGKIAYGRRKTKKNKITGKISQEKADNYIISKGIHESIIDDELWELTQKKRKSQAKKYEKINRGNDEKTYLLSSLIKCPVCGAGLYGNKSRKRKNNGEHYKDYYYYSCKHRQLMNGYKCNFSKQIKADAIDSEVATIITKIISNPSFAKKLEEKINIQIDTDEIDKIIDKHMAKERQLLGTKASLINQIDSLDFEDKHYERKFEDLNLRLDAIYDQLDYVELQISDSRKRKEAILEEKITSDNIYKILINFHKLYSVLSDVDKKRLFNQLIEKIEIYGEKNESGRWVKSLTFKLTLIDEDINLSLDNDSSVESVVLMSKAD
ncbi:recombinase family protein [Anaerococcus hydrogenalis]|uniref:Resolvase n=2 Tax=Anaerococcus hydrogenalis TaxID=33029 RepID=A0A2N6UKK1_9FIRM|nr:recombinase family protein [Anaerococcus hydrogenalis]MDK7694344.1 recombinase family protein [Anaerococcus hydrogenalis]MDK7696122.1 recombinase family protein [Anaerococcus hydrogenalis]MDK7707371.1 recombinase family protein [Anaerococcus hydrogenalis]PMC82388.1 resolvase [Anaerococcus hydrogenalis]